MEPLWILLWKFIVVTKAVGSRMIPLWKFTAVTRAERLGRTAVGHSHDCYGTHNGHLVKRCILHSTGVHCVIRQKLRRVLKAGICQPSRRFEVARKKAGSRGELDGGKEDSEGKAGYDAIDPEIAAKQQHGAYFAAPPACDIFGTDLS
ncbi:hypothetical protein Q3G72_015614 [Acer saccharum]|nr:hypothetical protein Q3G72_015614 [Acer saccharum]